LGPRGGKKRRARNHHSQQEGLPHKGGGGLRKKFTKRRIKARQRDSKDEKTIAVIRVEREKEKQNEMRT